MTTEVVQSPMRRLGGLWKEAMRGEGQAWLYVFKGAAAILIAGGLAMLLRLPSPTVSMVTVLIVMNPQSGMVLAKSFYRVLGTVVGVSAAVAMVGMFPQSPYFLMTAMAVWVAICATNASMIRGFKGYGFLLAGYTAAMIILPVVNEPARIFTQAESRFFEVLLALGVSALVFDGVFPRSVSASVQAQASKNLSFLLGAVREGLTRTRSEAEHRIATARNADAMESLVTVGTFEGPWVSAISRPLRRSNHAFLQTGTRLHAWQKLAERLEAKGETEVLEALQALAEPLRERVAEPGDPEVFVLDLRQIGHDIRANAGRAAAQFSGASKQAYETGAALLRRIARSLLRAQQAQIIIASGRDTDKTAPRTYYTRTYDPVSALLTFVRTLVVCMGFGTLWIGDVMGTSGTPMFIVVALTSMLAPAPKPLAAVKLAALGHIIAPIIGLACFSILPLMTTFPLFAAAMLPFLLITLYISTRPGWAGLGMPMGIGLLVALAIGQKANLDVTTYLNETVATIMGVLLVAVGFLIIPGPAGRPSQITRYRRMLDRSVQMAGRRPLHGLASRIETRNRDLGLQLLMQQDPSSPAMVAYLDHAADVQECCYALVSLREAIGRPDVSDDLRMMVDQAVLAVVAAWPPRKATALQLRERDDALSLALEMLPAEPPISREREHLYLLIDALADLDQRQESN